MIHHNSQAVQAAKLHVLKLDDAFDRASDDELTNILDQYTAEHYQWRGLHPFHEQQSTADVVEVFWKPLRHSFTALQRRVDVFFASHNTISAPDTEHSERTAEEHVRSVWTCQMGHFMGLMDKPWLDIPPTGRMVFIRYAEFHRIDNGLIQESALFIDLIGVMRQAGQYPLPPSTGASFIYPGPATVDGVLHAAHPPEQGQATMTLIDKMVSDLSDANKLSLTHDDNRVPREVLARSWDENMIWYGPEGIGNFNFGEVAAAMQAGKVAMIVDGTSIIAQSVDPDKSQFSDQIELASVPSGPAGRSPAIAVHGLGIPADAPNPEASFKFIEWATSEDVLTKIALSQSYPDFTRASVGNNAEVLAKYESIHPRFLELRIAALNDAIGHYRPLLPQWPDIGLAVGESINAAVNGIMTNEEALQAADEEIADLMAN